MPSTPETISVNDTIYTLDGLILAYQEQLKTFNRDLLQIIENHIHRAFTTRPTSEAVISAIQNAIVTNYKVLHGIAKALRESDEFNSYLHGVLSEVLSDRLHREAANVFSEQFETFWSNRQSMINAEITNLMNARFIKEAGQQTQLRITLADLMADDINAIVEAKVEERLKQLPGAGTATAESAPSP